LKDMFPMPTILTVTLDIYNLIIVYFCALRDMFVSKLALFIVNPIMLMVTGLDKL